MSWSIKVNVSADGIVTVTAKDCHGGCPYRVAVSHGNGWTVEDEREDPDGAAHALGESVRVDPHREVWDCLMPHIEKAVAELYQCLPYRTSFDEEGQPK